MGNEISLKEVGSHDLFFFLLLRVSAARVKSAAMLYCFIWTGPTSGTLLLDVCNVPSRCKAFDSFNIPAHNTSTGKTKFRYKNIIITWKSYL